MLKHVRQELHRIVHSWVLLAVLLAGLIFQIVLNNAKIIGVWDSFYPESPFYELMTRGDFVWEFDPEARWNRKLTFESVKELLHMEDNDAQNIEELFDYTSEAQFSRVMWFFGGLVLLSVLLPMALVTLPLRSGVPRLSATLSGSPRRVALAKVAVFFLVAAVMSLLGSLIQLAVYAPAASRILGFGFCLRGILLRMLMDCMVLSIPLFLAFVLRNPLLSALVNLLYGILCYALGVLSVRETMLFIPIPPMLHSQWLLWRPQTSPLWALLAAVVALAYIVLFSWLSVRAFERKG